MHTKITSQKIGYLFKETFLGFIDDNALKLSAALSYYTIFSLPPLLIIIISLSGMFFGNQAVQVQIFEQINQLFGNGVALQIQEILKNVTLSNNNIFVASIGIVILIVGASGVFAEIQDSLNFIWGIKAKPKRGLIKFIYNRLMSFSMIVSVGFLLLVSLIINSVVDVLNKQMTLVFPHNTILLFKCLNVCIVFIIITVLFIIIFKTLPDGKIAFRDSLIGALFTAFLFMIGKFAIGTYLSKYNIASIYGAAGSVILILAWVYYSAIILYFGAEFTKVYAQSKGRKIMPNEYTVQLKK